MESNEISIHEVRVYRALKAATGWTTASILAEQARVAPRTARHHALKFVRLGIADQAEVFPSHRYRLSDHAIQRNRGYVDRLDQADSVFGETEAPTERGADSEPRRSDHRPDRERRR